MEGTLKAKSEVMDYFFQKMLIENVFFFRLGF